MNYPAGSYRHILRLSVPIIIGAIAQNVILATDALFMATVDAVSLDAVGLGGLYFSTFFVLGLGFSIGVQILIARRHGEGNLPAIGQVFNSSLQILLALGLLLWGVIEWLSPLLLNRLIDSRAVYEKTIQYVDQRAWGIVFAFFSLSFRSLYIGVSRSMVITITTIITALSNVFFNYVLIFGKFGFPELGIAGAAMASSIAEVFGAIGFIVYMQIKGSVREFSLFRHWKVKLSHLKHVSQLSAPMMLQFFLSHAGWFVFFLVIERLGERALAISVLIRIIYMFQMVPFWGFNAASNTIVSYLIGENKPEEVIPGLLRVCRLSVVASLIIILPNLIAPEWVISLAAGNADQLNLVAEAVPTLRVISVALLLFGISMTFFSGVSGSGNTRFALFIEVVTITFYVFFSWLLGSRTGALVHEVWYTEVFYFLLIGLISVWYMRSGRWKQISI